MGGLWFAGSRSGWIALATILIAALYLKAATVREIAISVAGVVAIALTPVLLPWLLVALHAVQHWLLSGGAAQDSQPMIPELIPEIIPQIIPSASSTQERLVTLVGGWYLFLEHPIFGAGLGAFRNLSILSAEGFPLIIHSSPLWLMAELGLVGLVIFLAPPLFVLVSEFRRKDRDPASRLLVLCLIAFAVMSGPADMLYQRTFWILLGAGLAVPYRR
jgi:O-antigen ligase